MPLGVKLKIMVTALALGFVIYLKFFVDLDDMIKDAAEEGAEPTNATASSVP